MNSGQGLGSPGRDEIITLVVPFQTIGNIAATEVDRKANWCGGDPAFGEYVLLATATACLTTKPDPSCDRVFARLDQLRGDTALLDLLRAHRSARQ